MKDKFAKQKRVKVGEISDNVLEEAKITIENVIATYAHHYPEVNFSFLETEKGFEIYADAEIHDRAGFEKLVTDLNKNGKWKYLKTQETKMDPLDVERMQGEYNGILQIETVLEDDFTNTILRLDQLLEIVAGKKPVKKIKKTVVVLGREINNDKKETEQDKGIEEWTKLEDVKEAKHKLDDARKYDSEREQAIKTLEEQGMIEDAIELQFRYNWTRAKKLAEKHNKIDKLIELYAKEDCEDLAALFAEKHGQTDKAIELYKKAGMPNSASELEKKMEEKADKSKEKIFEITPEMADKNANKKTIAHEIKTTELPAKKETIDEQIEKLKKVGAELKAAKMAEENGKYDEAIKIYEEEGFIDKAIELKYKYGTCEEIKKLAKKYGKVDKLINLYLKDNYKALADNLAKEKIETEKEKLEDKIGNAQESKLSNALQTIKSIGKILGKGIWKAVKFPVWVYGMGVPRLIDEKHEECTNKYSCNCNIKVVGTALATAGLWAATIIGPALYASKKLDEKLIEDFRKNPTGTIVCTTERGDKIRYFNAKDALEQNIPYEELQFTDLEIDKLFAGKNATVYFIGNKGIRKKSAVYGINLKNKKVEKIIDIDELDEKADSQICDASLTDGRVVVCVAKGDSDKVWYSLKPDGTELRTENVITTAQQSNVCPDEKHKVEAKVVNDNIVYINWNENKWGSAKTIEGKNPIWMDEEEQ